MSWARWPIVRKNKGHALLRLHADFGPIRLSRRHLIARLSVGVETRFSAFEVIVEVNDEAQERPVVDTFGIAGVEMGAKRLAFAVNVEAPFGIEEIRSRFPTGPDARHVHRCDGVREPGLDLLKDLVRGQIQRAFVVSDRRPGASAFLRRISLALGDSNELLAFVGREAPRDCVTVRDAVDLRKQRRSPEKILSMMRDDRLIRPIIFCFGQKSSRWFEASES